MGQYFCQALGALKSHPAEDTACEQETETKQETKSDASSDRCVRYIHVCTRRMVEWCHSSIMFGVYVYVQCCECVSYTAIRVRILCETGWDIYNCHSYLFDHLTQANWYTCISLW